MKIISNRAIDRSRWDKIVLENSALKMYNLSWYLDTVAPEWEVITDEEGLFQLPVPVRKKMGMKYVFAPNFIQCMQICSTEKPSTETEVQFLEFLLKQYRHVHFNFLPQNDLKEFAHLKSKHRRNIEMDLTSADFEFSENTKRNIKKADKEHVDVRFGNTNFEDVKQLFLGGIHAKKIPNDFLEDGKLIFRQMQMKSELLHAGAFKNNELMAAAIFVLFRHDLVFLFSGSTADSKKNGAMHLLISETIKHVSAKNKALKRIDFEGSDHEGLARFYRSFGGKEKLYLQLNKNLIKDLFK